MLKEHLRLSQIVHLPLDLLWALGYYAIQASLTLESITSDFNWPFLPPYMGVIPNPKMTFIFPISCILALIFQIFIIKIPKCSGKGSSPKSQIITDYRFALNIFVLTASILFEHFEICQDQSTYLNGLSNLLLLWIIYVIPALFCYAFMHVCLLMP